MDKEHPLEKMFNELEELVKPEGDVNHCISHLKDTMRAFFRYMQEIKDTIKGATNESAQ